MENDWHVVRALAAISETNHYAAEYLVVLRKLGIGGNAHNSAQRLAERVSPAGGKLAS